MLLINKKIISICICVCFFIQVNLFANKNILTTYSGSNNGFGNSSFGAINGLFTNTTTENRTQYKVRNTGVFSNLKVSITANSVNADGKLTLRINGVDSTLTTAITTLTTGVFSDVAHSVSVASTDLINVIWATQGTSGNSTLATYSLLFNATANTSTRIIATAAGTGTYSSTSITQFLNGPTIVFDTTETNRQIKINQSGTLGNLDLLVGSNGRTTSTAFKDRINGVDGTLLITVTGSATGRFEDTTHTDSINAGDLINFSVLGGAEVTSITFSPIGMDYTNTAGYMAFGGVSAISQGSNSDRVSGLFSGPTGLNTEAQGKIRIQDAFTASNIGIYLSVNTSPFVSTCLLRQNGSSTALSASITATTTGWFMDSTHTISVVSGDDIDILTSGGTAANLTSQALTMTGFIAPPSSGNTSSFFQFMH